jgi:Raf kinase inhibitor-like YbhB/YbcL family protein
MTMRIWCLRSGGWRAAVKLPVATAATLVGLGLGSCSKKQDNQGPVDKSVQAPQPTEQPSAGEAKVSKLTISSSAFSHQGEIPKKYTCEGEDLSPPLSWSNLPAGTKSLALIVDDPDAPDPAAPRRVWVHWVIYNLAPTQQGLPEGVKQAPEPARDGVNDWGRTGYGGPCPPIGRHRYFHKLYALDTELDGLSKPTKAQLEKAMQGHIVAQGELIGTYQKGK